MLDEIAHPPGVRSFVGGQNENGRFISIAAVSTDFGADSGLFGDGIALSSR